MPAPPAPGPRLLVPAAGPAPAAGGPGAAVRTFGGRTMGTTWSVKAVLAPERAAAPLVRGIEACLGAVIRQMSPWEPDSDISRFNRAPAGTWQALPAAFFAVLDYALALARDTAGAYDPTIGALVGLWGFGPEGPVAAPPPPAAVAAARARCGHARVAVDRAQGRALQPGGVALDLSSAAKGYAVDLVAEYLAAAGVGSFLVEIGGELRGQGRKPDGAPWLVALEEPPPAPPATLVALHGLAVATSGDYRRRFEHGGRCYAHTIDPRTGLPAVNGLASVAVLHPRCLCADALATALMVLGPEAGPDYARRRGLAARFVLDGTAGPRERVTPEFAAMVA